MKVHYQGETKPSISIFIHCITIYLHILKISIQSSRYGVDFCVAHSSQSRVDSCSYLVDP